MRYILENDTLRVEIESFGAEIKSVKRKADGREYMWCGDPKYWGRTSPVLFPFVGAPTLLLSALPPPCKYTCQRIPE